MNVSAPAPPRVKAKPGRPIVRFCLVAFSLAVILAAGSGTLLAFGARHAWHLELASHFRLQYFWALAIATFLLALVRYWKLASVAGLLAGINLMLIVPLYFGPARLPQLGPRLRAMSFNVHYLNHDYGATIELIMNEKPDFVELLEVTPEWVEALKFLKPDYPYEKTLPIENGGGIALYSRYPIKDLSIHEVPYTGLQTIEAELEVPGRSMTLIATHPASPGSPQNFEYRNRQLEQVAQLARKKNGPVMLMGDLNTTSWSPYFHDLLRDSGLRDSRLGFGVEPSWPWLPSALVRIPIDHCLVSPSISILNRRIGPAIGSDHRPLLVDFAIAPVSETAAEASTPSP